MYKFKRLIKKYSKVPVYQIEEGEGFRDPNNGGQWVEGVPQEILIEDGAVVPLSNNDITFDEGGTYTAEDRKLYCYIELKKGTKVKHKGRSYTILEDRDYTDFDVNLRIYFLKRGGTD